MNRPPATCSGCGRPGHGSDDAECPRNRPRMTREDFRASKGLPRTGLGMDHSLISPNGRLSKRAASAATDKLRDTWRKIDAVDTEYDAKVLAGEIIEPSGATLRHLEEQREKKRATLRNQIQFYRHVGLGKRGKVKPTFQRIIDGYQAELDALG